MHVSFELKVYNDQDKPRVRVALTHESIDPVEKTKVVQTAGPNGGAVMTETRMHSDRKICVLRVNDEEYELSVDELKFAVERL